MKLRLLVMCLLLAGGPLAAQSFEVPQQVSLKLKEDYARYEPKVIEAAAWLESHAVGQDEEKRNMVNAFVLQWISGSPTVTVEIHQWVMDLTEKNPQLLLVFMAGYARFVLQNQYSTNRLKAFTEGVASVLRCYQLGGELKHSKPIEKALAQQQQQQLEAWVALKLKK